MKMIHGVHVLFVIAAAVAGGKGLPTCFAFVYSKCRPAFPFLPTQHAERSLSHLFYYKSDEPFSERLNVIQSELESIKDEGLHQFIIDELTSAQKKLMNDFDYALQFANKVSDSDSDEIRLAKKILKGALERGREIANEVREVKREFDELQAAKILEGISEDIVKKNFLVEKDLENVTERVATALKDAEEVLHIAILTAASQDELTDETKGELIKKLELSAKTVEEAIKVADAAAKNAKAVVIDDEATLALIEKASIRLTDAVETTEMVILSLEGSEGGAEVDALADSLTVASDEMVKDLNAVENIAAAVTRKIELQADAVLAMDEKASQALGTINTAKISVEQSYSETDKDSLRTSLKESADKLQVDETAANELAEAIKSDINTDAAALQVISDADEVFDELIGSVKETVDEVVSDYNGGEDMDDAAAISDELGAVHSGEEQAEKAIKLIEDAEEKVSESAVGGLHGELIQSDARKIQDESPKVVVESKTGSDSSEKAISEAPSSKQHGSRDEHAEQKEHPEQIISSAKPASGDEAATISIDSKKAESSISASDLEPEQVHDGNKVENVQLHEEETSKMANRDSSVNGGDSSGDSHVGLTAHSNSSNSGIAAGERSGGTNEIPTDSVDIVQKIGVSEEVTAPTSALHDTGTAIGNGGNEVGETSHHIESMKTAIASASDVVPELTRKAIDSVGSAHETAARVATQSLAEVVVVATSFFHF